jgi:hypothetical protein
MGGGIGCSIHGLCMHSRSVGRAFVLPGASDYRKLVSDMALALGAVSFGICLKKTAANP